MIAGLHKEGAKNASQVERERERSRVSSVFPAGSETLFGNGMACSNCLAPVYWIRVHVLCGGRSQFQWAGSTPGRERERENVCRRTSLAICFLWGF